MKEGDRKSWRRRLQCVRLGICVNAATRETDVVETMERVMAMIIHTCMCVFATVAFQQFENNQLLATRRKKYSTVGTTVEIQDGRADG
jgi:hypothetical protein